MAAPRVDPYNNGVILGLKLCAFKKLGWKKKINVTYGCKTAPEGWNWSELGENLGRVHFSVKKCHSVGNICENDPICGTCWERTSAERHHMNMWTWYKTSG